MSSGGVGSTEPPKSEGAGFAGAGAGRWEPVVGLEIHVQLKTRTKMFCRCANGFGGGENTQTCPVCLGFPGALPVPNRVAIEWVVKLGLALGCEVAPRAVFAPSSNATVGEVGETSTSKRSNAAACSRTITVRTFCAWP